MVEIVPVPIEEGRRQLRVCHGASITTTAIKMIVDNHFRLGDGPFCSLLVFVFAPVPVLCISTGSIQDDRRRHVSIHIQLVIRSLETMAEHTPPDRALDRTSLHCASNFALPCSA